jgi:hypothetical protein
VATNSAAEELSFRRGIRQFGGESGRGASIPSTGRQKTATGTFSAPWRRRGARDDGPRWRPWRHVRSLGGCSWERERIEPEREEGEDVSWRHWASPGELLGGLGGKQEMATVGTWEPPRR